MSEISFSYERRGTKTRFGKEAKGNSEMAYCNRVFSCVESELTVYVGRLLELSGTSSVSSTENTTTTCSENGEFDQ